MTERNLEDLGPEDGLTDEDEDAPDYEGPAEPREHYSPAEAEDSSATDEDGV